MVVNIVFENYYEENWTKLEIVKLRIHYSLIYSSILQGLIRQKLKNYKHIRRHYLFTTIVNKSALLVSGQCASPVYALTVISQWSFPFHVILFELLLLEICSKVPDVAGGTWIICFTSGHLLLRRI